VSDHYFSHNPDVESKPQQISFDLLGYNFRFKTDQGVFSKGDIDFGSRVLIDAFECPSIDGPFLDVGCGYGPIGLAFAKAFPARRVHMIDVNNRALSLAKENAAEHNIVNVDIYESDTYDQVEERNFAAIITNPPIRAGKDVVHKILIEGYERLLVGGEIWVVIQKKQGAPSAMKKLEEIYGNVEIVGKKKGYYILKSTK
jgi:16S rRNA (guanine1207-N2)-methyltransferase